MDDELNGSEDTNSNNSDDSQETTNDDPTPVNPDTILSDVKRKVGIQPEVTEFDLDMVSHINSAFFVLYQLGVGPETPFTIDSSTEWSSYETIVPKDVVLDYLYLKTKLIFDPPAASNIYEAYKDRIAELEFRMNIMVDNGGGIVTG